MSRLLTICRALVKNPHLGVSEKEAYFELHFLNARNEINELERILGITLHREREESQTGRYYTRYTPENASQIRKLAEFYNAKLAANVNNRFYKGLTPLSDVELAQSIALLGKGE